MGQPGEPDFTGAACSGLPSEAFFPERGTAQVTARDAKAICNGENGQPVCPVRTVCLEYALEQKERFGIWGGMSERERARIAKDRRVAVQRQEQEVVAQAERRRLAARKGWENRRRLAVEMEQAAAAATRTKENSAKSSTHPSKRRRGVAA